MTLAIRRVLIANRGEIAVSAIRACRGLGTETVQACSQADRDSLAMKLADRAVCIGRALDRELSERPILHERGAGSQSRAGKNVQPGSPKWQET